jgi:hypothetical protein
VGSGGTCGDRPHTLEGLMDNQVQKSCWGIATWTVLILGSVLVLTLALGDIGSVTVASQ